MAFDSGSNAMFSGLDFGLRLAAAREEAARRQEALALAARRADQTDALRRDQLKETTRYHDITEQGRQQGRESTDKYRAGMFGLSADRLYRDVGNDERKQFEREQTSRAGADFIMGPQLDQAQQGFMQGPPTPEAAQFADQTNAQHQNLAGLNPEAQKPFLEQAEKAMAMQMGEQKWAERSQMAADMKLANAQAAYDFLPEHMKTPERKAELIAKAMTGYSMNMGQREAVQARWEVAKTHQTYLEARSEHEESKEAVKQFKEEHSRDLREPDETTVPKTITEDGGWFDGKPAREVPNPVWVRHEEAKKALAELEAAAKLAFRVRQDAYKASTDAKRSNPQQQQPGASAAPPDPAKMDRATAQAWSEMGENANPAAIHERAFDILNTSDIGGEGEEVPHELGEPFADAADEEEWQNLMGLAGAAA